jgi:hypothetical protein
MPGCAALRGCQRDVRDFHMGVVLTIGTAHNLRGRHVCERKARRGRRPCQRRYFFKGPPYTSCLESGSACWKHVYMRGPLCPLDTCRRCQPKYGGSCNAAAALRSEHRRVAVVGQEHGHPCHLMLDAALSGDRECGVRIYACPVGEPYDLRGHRASAQIGAERHAALRESVPKAAGRGAWCCSQWRAIVSDR